MGGRACKTARDEFERCGWAHEYVCAVSTRQGKGTPLALANVDDKGAGDGGYVDPFAGEVLDLETGVGRRLEELS